ncbi:MAG TPA: PilN domain-containing protein [Rhodanobacteraceae bacterium]|nr:PilN domain-containing protein [Rhodanobacteraceae bacterium]
MNPVLERQLTRLRTRLAKTPLPGFFSWWGRELVACLPQTWRARINERSESLLIDLRADEMIVWRERADRASEYARIARTLPADAQGAEFQRLRNAIDDPGVRTVLCIPAERVLQRDLTLPAAAEENLRQVLAFEMDRQTPFKSDQVYFDSRITGRDASGRNLRVELVLLPRAQLDQEIGALPQGAAQLDGIDAWRAEPGGARRHVNLLPQERRARRRDMRLPLNLGLAAFAVILFFVNMDEALTNRAAAVEAMRAEVEKSNNEAKQVAALRKTLTDSIAGANFLSDKKRNSPLTVALLDDLSRRLPEDTFLERLQIENGEAQLQGQSKEAAKLISMLGSSSCIGDPRLQGQIQPDARTGKERFQITADVKPCNGKPADIRMPPASDTASGKHETAPLKPEATTPAKETSKDAPKKTTPAAKDMTAVQAAANREKEKRAQQERAKKDAARGNN